MGGILPALQSIQMSNYPDGMSWEDLIYVGEIDDPIDIVISELSNAHKGDAAPVTIAEIEDDFKAAAQWLRDPRSRNYCLSRMSRDLFSEIAAQINADNGFEEEDAAAA